MSSINRKLADIISNTGDVKKAALDNGASMEVYDSIDLLPTAGMSSGDQALVGQRLYISNGSGWYNVALINATPRLTLSQDGSIALATDGTTATTITLTAADSDNSDANLSLTAESGGDFFKMATVSQDSSVFTITPRSKDSCTTLGSDLSSTLTFKASDGIAFASNQVTFTLSFSIANSQYTTFLMKADDAATDNQVDASSNTYSVTETGNVTSSAYSPYHSGGYSLDFDGNGDYLSFTANSDFSLSGDFTIEAWVYLRSITLDTNHPNLIVLGSTNIFFDSSNNYVAFYHGSEIVKSANSSIDEDKWHHIAVTRSGTAIKLFLDGALAASATASTTYGTSSGTQYVGSMTASNGNLDGYIRDLRVVNGTAVYTSAFDVPTTTLTAVTNTKLLVCNTPYVEDVSTSQHAITIGGNVATVRFGPYVVSDEYTKSAHGGSVYFDGSGDYYTVGSASDGGLTGTFTIECWFMLKEAYDAKVHTLISNYDGSADGWGLQLRTGGELWLFAAVGQPLSYTLSPKQNVWYHVAVSNDSGNNTGKLFVNGRQVDTHSDANIYDTADMQANSVPITIGRLGNNSTQDMYGYIADVRILSGTHLRTAAFTPPTSPLTAISNTKVLTARNTNDVWDQANGAVLLKNTALPANDTQRKWTGSGVSAIRSSGTWFAQEMAKPLGGGDFCIEGWVYFDTNNDPHGVFHTGSGASSSSFNYGNANGCALGLNGSTGLWRVYHAGSATNASTQASATTWHHFAYVRYNGTIKLYVDGSATDISVSNTTDFTEPQLIVGGYYSATYTMAGYLQDVRVSVGNARYTGNFTAPTAAFTG